MAWINRYIEIEFARPACKETKTELKAFGFRYCSRRHAWIHNVTPEAEQFAAELIERDRLREAELDKQARESYRQMIAQNRKETR